MKILYSSVFVVFAITLSFVNSCPCQHGWYFRPPIQVCPPNMIWKLVPDGTACTTSAPPCSTTSKPCSTTTCPPPSNCQQKIIIQVPQNWAKEIQVQPTGVSCDDKKPSFVCSCGKHHHVHNM